MCILFVFYPFWAFFYEIDHQIFRYIEFVSIWWPCLFVFSLHGNDAGVWGLPFSDFLWFFFSPHRLTHPKPGNLFDAKRTKRGWPKPYGFFLGFLTTLLLRISVYLSFALFCSFLSVKWTETVQWPSIFPLEVLERA